jgi:hypothetical protein
MTRTILLIPFALAIIANVNAQSIGPATLNATGGSKIIGTNEFDWSVGEMTMISTFTTSNVIVTQGILQPSDAMTGVPHTSILADHLQVFPNPVSSVITIHYSSPAAGTLEYRLLDMTGKVMANQTVEINQGINDQQIDMSSLACAAYILEVTTYTQGTESISYKIQKIN